VRSDHSSDYRIGFRCGNRPVLADQTYPRLYSICGRQRGGAEALADIVAGRIDFYYCPISTTLPFIEDKWVLALAASTSTRAPELPDVPTSVDAGYPNSDLTIWYGVFMPSQTARVIVETFHAAATKVLATPTLQQRLKQLAINPMPMTPSDMDKYVVAELSSNEKLIRAAGIK
jgi:tripartite-type tricarboxylate transporter receptor subunit TctC